MASLTCRIALAALLTFAIGCDRGSSAGTTDLAGGDGNGGNGNGGNGGNGGGGGGGGDGNGDMAGTGGTADGGTPDLGVPSDVIDKLLALTATCTAANMVSAHTYPDPGSAVPNVPICALKGAVFYNANMDIDCDGRPTAGKCPGPDPSYQDDTAFHNKSDQPLEAAVTPYVVIPSDFAYPGLDSNNGGNVIAVIYNHQLQYAVFGDTGPTNLIGEASYACANNLGISPDPATGGVDRGVTYVVFVGANTAPHDIEDQAETKKLGDQLLTQLLANN